MVQQNGTEFGIAWVKCKWFGPISPGVGSDLLKLAADDTPTVVGKQVQSTGTDSFMSNKKLLRNTDQFIASAMYFVGPVLLKFSVAIIFIWFGMLKVVQMSPAQELVENTVYWFSNPPKFVVFLGIWEVLIGITICVRPLIRLSLFLLFLQMPGTFLPLVLLPEVCFTSVPFGLTLEGQYIVKNLVLISAAIVVGGSVRSQRNSPAFEFSFGFRDHPK